MVVVVDRPFSVEVRERVVMDALGELGRSNHSKSFWELRTPRSSGILGIPKSITKKEKRNTMYECLC